MENLPLFAKSFLGHQNETVEAVELTESKAAMKVMDAIAFIVIVVGQTTSIIFAGCCLFLLIL